MYTTHDRTRHARSTASWATALLIALVATHSLPAKAVAQAPNNESAMGMISSAHPLATAAGNDILEAGGNAADAAVATGFALSVVEHAMNGIGGRNQILVRTADGDYFGIDGHTEVPYSFEVEPGQQLSGHAAVGIPGVVAALVRLSEEHGTLPLPTVMAPAIRLAEEGYRLLPGGAARHARAPQRFGSDPGASAAFLKPDGTQYLEGDLLRLPEMGAVMRKIAEGGAEAFYEGEIAEAIAADMAANGGFLTARDLADYRTREGRIVRTTYRGYDVTATAAPAGGGLVVRSLNIMENFDLASMTEVQWAAVVNQAMALASVSMIEDPYDLNLTQIQSKAWAREAASEIRIPDRGDWDLDPDIYARGVLSLDGSQEQSSTMTDWMGEQLGEPAHHTTHWVTGDCSGMAVSVTQTLGPGFGAGVVTPGLGFFFAETLGTAGALGGATAGDRPRTTIAPTILSRDGHVELALGAAGGFRILSAVVETISRRVDHGMSLEEAVAAPRVQPGMAIDMEAGTFGIVGEELIMETTPENGWDPATLAELTAQGFEVTETPRYASFGRVNAVTYDGSTWTGAADLDWEGSAFGPERSFCTQN